MEYLRSIFGNRLISNLCKPKWPPRSPDLTPLDFWFWSQAEIFIHKRNPENFWDIKQGLEDFIATVSEDEIRRSIQHTRKRAKACLAMKGGIFENRLKKNEDDIIIDSDDEENESDGVEESGDTIGDTIEIEAENERIEVEPDLENVGVEDSDTDSSITSSISIESTKMAATKPAKKPVTKKAPAKKTAAKPAKKPVAKKAPAKKTAAKPKNASREEFGLRKIRKEDEIETMEITDEENLENNVVESEESESEGGDDIFFRVEEARRNYEEGMNAIENLEKLEKEAEKEEKLVFRPPFKNGKPHN